MADGKEEEVEASANNQNIVDIDRAWDATIVEHMEDTRVKVA
jgi:hypothetical protein